MLFFAVLAVSRLLLLDPARRAAFDSNGHFALAVALPFSAVLVHCLAAFGDGLEGDLAGRRSMVPARRFLLPVTSAALAGWPMLLGTSTVAALWLATRGLAPWPAGVEIPWLWPAVFCAVILAWTQALTWSAYPLRGMRVVVMVLWLAGVGFAVQLALHLRVGDGPMFALLAPQLPIAYLVAWRAVARARRGETPDGRRFVAALALPTRFAGPRPALASPAEAQSWFEWRRHGRALPTLVLLVLPFELLLLFVFADAPSLVAATLVAICATPPFLAAFVAAAVSRSSRGGRDGYELTPFVIVRPISDTALVAAKIRTTVRSTLLTWSWLLLATAVALGLSGSWRALGEIADGLIDIFGPARAVAFVLLVLAAALVTTWKQLVQSLFVGLSGRPWLIRASVFVPLVLLTLLVPTLRWVLGNGSALAALARATPWILAVLVAAKLVAAAWVARGLVEGRLFAEKLLVGGALAWSLAVLGLHGLLVALVPAILVPPYVLALVAILAMPLVRLAAAPLALNRNRHR